MSKRLPRISPIQIALAWSSIQPTSGDINLYCMSMNILYIQYTYFYNQRSLDWITHAIKRSILKERNVFSTSKVCFGMSSIFSTTNWLTRGYKERNICDSCLSVSWVVCWVSRDKEIQIQCDQIHLLLLIGLVWTEFLNGPFPASFSLLSSFQYSWH